MVDPIVAHGLHRAFLAGELLFFDPCPVRAVDTEFGVALFTQHDHRGVVGDQAMFHGQVGNRLLKICALAEIVQPVLQILDLGECPQPLDFRVLVGTLGEFKRCRVTAALAGNHAVDDHAGLAMAPVMAKHDQLLATVEAADTFGCQVSDLDAAESYIHVMKRLVGQPGCGFHQFAGDVVTVGNIHGETV